MAIVFREWLQQLKMVRLGGGMILELWGRLSPVKRGLALHPKGSFSFYSKRQPGLVPTDPVRAE